MFEEEEPEPKSSSLIARLIVTPLRMAWTALVILTPLLGVWLASSLAAFLNGPIWAAVLVGALLFPILPLAWEVRGHVRYMRKEERKPRVLTFLDRMTLRTLFINLIFITGLLATFPKEAFTALATRGDWMLTDAEGEYVEPTREALFATAGGLEWLYLLTRDDPYARFDDGSAQDVTPTPTPSQERWKIARRPGGGEDDSGEQGGEHQRGEEGQVAGEEPSGEEGSGRREGEPLPWPMEAELHPIVASIPASAETSPKAVAEYIARHEDDPFQRVKALHDYAIDRLSYDHDRLRRNDLTWESQQPDVVFRERKAVCSGYALLLVEMGKHTGDKIVYVSGVSRDDSGDVSGAGHAWNAVEIEGAWYLLDATWNDPTNPDKHQSDNYRTSYLFTPPHIFGMDHFPEEPKWQLREEPITRGEFMRQPLVAPNFYVNGLELIDPKRSQFTADSRTFSLTIGNKHNKKVLTRLVAQGSSRTSDAPRCEAKGSDRVTLTCAASASGTYDVMLFAGEPGLTTYPYVGRFQVNVP